MSKAKESGHESCVSRTLAALLFYPCVALADCLCFPHWREDLEERDVFQLQKFFRLSPEMETWISDTEKAGRSKAA